MNICEMNLKNDERAIFALRELYSKYGYSQYKMSKFEEYDLYVRNKDFLISDSVITFTDTNGKLLALKPDVTLSIIKNSKDDSVGVQKVYYNENVYRVSKGTHSFKEIMQVGLECVGDIDEFHIFEVLMLAVKSLMSISDECILDVSDLSVVSAVVDMLGVDRSQRPLILKCIGEKNLHELQSICNKNNADKSATDTLLALVGTHGKPEDVIAKLSPILPENSLDTLKNITDALSFVGCGDIVRIDFSVINDMNYYNGITFKGFVSGIPTGVLSGGQYDKLMQKMGRKSKAIGFAVYLDLLERLTANQKEFDAQAVLLYDENTDLATLVKAVQNIENGEQSVTVLKQLPEKFTYKQLYKITDGEVEKL